MTRFIIITLPDAAVCAEIEILRKPLCERFCAFETLRYPPHVTLRTGALVPEGLESEFLEGIRQTLTGVHPFPMRTTGLYTGSYTQDQGSKPIVALEIEKTEQLISLNHRLLTYAPFRKSNRLTFRPHLSLLFGDLTEENLERFRNEAAIETQATTPAFEWTCNNLSIYKQDGDNWLPYHLFPFES